MNWEFVAEAMDKRMQELGMDASELARVSGLSTTLISWLTTAKKTSYRRGTLAKVAAALGWTVSSFERIGEGNEPILLGTEPESPPMTRPGETRIQVDAADGARLVEIPADELRRMRELIDKLLGE